MFTTCFSDAVRRVSEAQYPEDLFIHKEESPKIVYRKLRGALHQVHTPKGDEIKGQRAFEKLLIAWKLTETLVVQGTFGTRTTRIASQSAVDSGTFFVKSKKGTYSGLVSVHEGNVAEVYRGTDISGKTVIVKISRTPECNEFLEREAKHLGLMHEQFPASEPGRYFPILIDNFAIAEGSDRLLVNVFEYYDGYHTLSYILQSFKDAGQSIDVRSAAWMYNRILESLAHAYPLSIVHGGIHPDNILVHPESHRIVLTGWTSSVRQGDAVRYVAQEFSHMYPQEVIGAGKRKAHPATDLYMAAAVVTQVLGGEVGKTPLPVSVPREVRAFLDARLTGNVGLRDGVAIRQRDRFGEILAALFGPPAFRHFVLPSTSRR